MTAQYRYSVWPGGPMPLPRLNAWFGTVDGDGWFSPWMWDWGPDDDYEERYGLKVSRGSWPPDQIDAPQDLHVHEFADVDLGDVESVLDFASTVGLPVPGMIWNGQPWRDLWDDDDGSTYAEAVRWAAEHVGINPPDEVRRSTTAQPKEGRGLGEWHHAEIALRVLRIREFVKVLGALSAGDESLESVYGVGHVGKHRLIWWDMFVQQLNAGLATEHVRVMSSATDYGITNCYGAACLAVANDLALNAHYLRCKNETCQRLFTRQRGRSSKGEHRTIGVVYCSPSCARAQSQRVRRRNQRGQG